MTDSDRGARWERVQALFHELADLSTGLSEARLSALAAEDPELAAEVRALLEADRAPDAAVDLGVAPLAAEVLGSGIPAALLQQSFGPYRIVSAIGEGGMGTVYRAVRSDLNSEAALKILRDASLSPSRRERFAAEQRTLAQLSHPAIAQFLDADTLPDGTPWLAMEYVEGQPVTDYCTSHDSSLRGRLTLFRRICQAVQHAHGHAVIHRDLKPSNILVRPDGSVKLLDFGIAKQLESLQQSAEQTRTGLRLMTPAYAAPEQLRGEQVGTFTDVYALGVVLYELLTNQLPYYLAGASPATAERIVTEREPTRPSVVVRNGGEGATRLAREVGRASWADLDVLVLTAMHRDRERRYPTVDALIRDIDHFLDKQPLGARPDTIGYRLGKFVRRNSQVVAATLVAVAVVVTVVGFYTLRLAGARNEAQAETDRTQRIQAFMLDLFRGGEEEAGPADSLRVLTLIDRGLQEARSLDREPAVQAELYQTLGGIYQKLGNLARADTLLQASLDRRKMLFGDHHPDVARSLVGLGLLRIDQARFEEAEQLTREGLAMTRESRRPDHPDVAAAIVGLGRTLEEGGKYDEAIAVLEEAVRLRTPSGETPELAAAIYGLANNQFYAGHYDQADSLTRLVMGMSRRVHGDRHPSVAEDLINLGAIQHEQGEYPKAEQYYREALSITRGWYGETHPKTASNLTMLGRTLLYQQRYPEADSLLTEALGIQERVYGPMHPRVASALNELGSLATVTGKLDEAERYHRRVVEIYRTVYPGGHYLIGVAQANLASVWMSRQDWPRAEQGFRQALAAYQGQLPEDHLNVAITRIKLGRTLIRQQRYDEAEQATRGGYEVLVQQTDQGSGFLRAARTDLAEGYEALGKPELAARFRAELVDTGTRPPGN